MFKDKWYNTDYDDYLFSLSNNYNGNNNYYYYSKLEQSKIHYSSTSEFWGKEDWRKEILESSEENQGLLSP